jgi:hypothetical protein
MGSQIEGTKKSSLLSEKDKLGIFVCPSNGLTSDRIIPLTGRNARAMQDVLASSDQRGRLTGKKVHPSKDAAQNIQQVIGSTLANRRPPICQVAISDQSFPPDWICIMNIPLDIGGVG